MLLAEAVVGQVLTINQVGGERSFRRRLLELGLVPGTELRLVGVAPLGDPLEVVVRGCSLSIRRAEAGALRVTSSDQGRAASVPRISVPAQPELDAVPVSSRVRLAGADPRGAT